MTKLEEAEEAFRSTSGADVEKSARTELQQQSEELRVGETPAAGTPSSEPNVLSFGYPQELTGEKFDPSKYAEGASGEGIFSRFRQQREERQKTDEPERTEPATAVETETVSSDIGTAAVERVDPRRNFTTAEDGSITAKFPNGDTRKFTTDGGKDIQTLEFYDNKTKLTHEFTRVKAAEGETQADGNATFEYKQKNAAGKVVSEGQWKGDLEWRDGVYAVREAAENKSAIPADFWRTERTDGTSQRERTNENGTTQVYDKNWGLLALKRPDGSSVECTRNEQGALTAVKHQDHTGKVTTWAPDQRGFWVASTGDVIASGKPPVDQLGELNYSHADGSKVKVHVNGSEERTNADGTKAITDVQGRVSKVVAADGSYREIQYQDEQATGFTDLAKDGTPKSSTEGYSNIRVNDHGYMSYERGDGTTVEEGPNNSRVEKYADGRIMAVRYPNGDTREFTYLGDTEKLDTFKLTTVNPKSTVEYDRKGDGEEFSYKSTNAAGKVTESVWNGDMAVRHGMFAFKGDGGKPGFWNERATDGKTYYERENADGSTQVFDANFKISSLYRTDGTELHCDRVNGELVGVTSVSGDNVKTCWTLNKQNNQWECDSDQIVPSKVAPINANGELLFHNTDGTHNKVTVDGTSERTNVDGTKASIDESGAVERLDRPDGTYRVFSYDNGKMNGYTDHAKDGTEQKSVKDLKEPFVNSHGDVGYRDEKGQLVLERTNGSTIKYSKDNDERLSEVKAPDGSVRHFYYDSESGKIQQVLDITHDGTNWNQDLWQSRPVIAANGNFSGPSSTFERVDVKSGNVLERRTGVKFGDFGDYSFNGAEGKTESSTASRGFRVPKPVETAKVEAPVKHQQQTRREIRQNRNNPQPEQQKPKAEAEKTEPAKPEPVKTVETPQVKEVAGPSVAERRAELAKTNVTTAEDGTITAKFSNGDVRTLQTVEGSNDVTSLKFSSARDNLTYEYSRVEASVKDGNADFKYTVTDASGRKVSSGTWSGAIQWKDNVLYSFDAPKPGLKSDGMWSTVAIDGERTRERVLADGGRLVYDASGQYNLMSVARPDGSHVECTRVDGNLVKITDQRSDGSQTSWTFDEKSRLWVSDDKSIIPSATAPINKQGELDYTDEQGSRTRVNFSGSVYRTNPDGSVAALDKNGAIDRVTQPSGEFRVFKRDDDGMVIGFSDHQKDGTEKRSVKDIRDARIDHYGLLNYSTNDGTNVSEGPKGVRVEQTAPDKTLIQYPDGDIRTFIKAEGGGLEKLTHFSKSENLTREYSKSGVAGEWNFKVLDAAGKETQVGVWKGQMEFRDGLFAVKGDNIKSAPKGFWFERDASDNQFIERENADGSRQRFDAKSALLETLYRTDGSRLDCHRPAGELIAVRNVDADGQETTWSFDSSQGKWISDSPDVLPSTKSPVTDGGVLMFQSKDGAQNQIESDGSVRRTMPGGTKVDISPEGVTSRITQRSGEYRVPQYDKESGAFTGYVDYDKTGKQQKSVELKDATINASGDIEYTVNGERTVERADRSIVQFESGDSSLVKRVTSAQGSYREFIRNEAGEVTAIDDVSKMKSGDKHALWTRRENVRPPFGPGGLSDTFERVVVNSSRVLDTRSNVAIGEFGDYTYRDSRGKDRVAAATGRGRGEDGFGTVSIDEAHDYLVDSAAACFGSESRSAAFEQLMKGFERRMADTVERRSSVEDREKVEEEVEKEVTQAYEAISRMLDTNAKGFDDPARRAQLAEALMYLLWEPQTAKQGGRNSCWFMSQWNEDLAAHPGTFAKMFSDVSMTGHCKDRHGTDYSFTANDLAQTRENHGVGWHLGRADKDSQTSPAVDRMERVLLKVGGWDTYRWQNGGDSNAAKNALAKVIETPIGFLGGQYPSTRQERLDMMRLGGAVKGGGPRHVNNMFVRAVRLDALGKVIQERAEDRREKRTGIVDEIGDESAPRRTVFGLFRGDQYEGGDKLVALIKDPKAFVETGEAAAVQQINYPAPKLGKEFQVADAYDASDFKPGTRPGDRNNNNNNQPLFRRRRRG
ncbi:MAG: hypothetical protein K2W95_19145 [Candidatus Obscuribacterales bacterium]|nr:hypothetical protein [Candidatus Obscuribacterales bacterium]